MSPIIELQRRMVEAGRIRAGDKTDNGAPRKLEKWRLTSKDEQRLERAAELWGGTVHAWPEGGGHEVYTDTDTLPIMLLPEQAPTTWYEQWSKGGCQRRCDGVHELISDSACLCGGDDRDCKPYTRLSVLLPDLPGIGSWMLTSTGWNAASELAGAAELLGRATAQGVLIPARLRLEQRHEVKAGQTRRFSVPVIDLDITFRELLGVTVKQDALPSGYTPLEIGAGVTVDEGLAGTEPKPRPRTGRSAAPIPETDDTEFGGAPTPPADDTLTEPTEPPDEKHTGPQTRKLNMLVGTLRDKGHISTEQLWAAIANARNIDADTMIGLLGGRDDDKVLHWSPLRDSLTKDEASSLIDRLERFEGNMTA